MEPTDGELAAFLDRVTPAKRQRDAATLLDLMGRITGERPHLYGSIIGFGSYAWRYESGRAGEGPAASFAPRKAATTIYLPDGVGAHADRLARLGAHTTGVGCLYLTDLSAVDAVVLEEIIRDSYRTLTSGTYGSRARDSQEGRSE